MGEWSWQGEGSGEMQSRFWRVTPSALSALFNSFAWPRIWRESVPARRTSSLFHRHLTRLISGSICPPILPTVRSCVFFLSHIRTTSPCLSLSVDISVASNRSMLTNHYYCWQWLCPISHCGHLQRQHNKCRDLSYDLCTRLVVGREQRKHGLCCLLLDQFSFLLIITRQLSQ